MVGLVGGCTPQPPPESFTSHPNGLRVPVPQGYEVAERTASGFRMLADAMGRRPRSLEIAVQPISAPLPDGMPMVGMSGKPVWRVSEVGAGSGGVAYRFSGIAYLRNGSDISHLVVIAHEQSENGEPSFGAARLVLRFSELEATARTNPPNPER